MTIALAWPDSICNLPVTPSTRWVRLIGFTLASLVVPITAESARGCVDQDDVMGQITRQQLGQGLTCAQVVLSGGSRTCDDAVIAGEICCSSCAVLLERLRTEHRRQTLELAAGVESARACFHGSDGKSGGNQRFRSPGLHGRGDGMPLLALGTAGLLGESGVLVLDFALRAGYRHLDSAIMYANHKTVKLAVDRSGVERSEIFITSKIPPNMMGFKKATDAVALFRDELPGGYADLCLVHWPYVESADVQTAEWTVVQRAGTWRALEEAFDAGTCRALGVSNFMVKHLQELRRYARIPPVVNQFEFSPLAPFADLVAYCREHGILVEAFGWRRDDVLEDPGLRQVAAELGRPVHEVLALWFLQQGMVPIYKSSRLERLLEYAKVLDDEKATLSPGQLARIGADRAMPNYQWRYYKSEKPWTCPTMEDVAAAGTCASEAAAS
eukprot:TRINITY_DN74139_c0_g1_i1.p1 TRINITY_DN74139_c0_g1~~TRINITY_DN74139_c0_g1_i1.p1  ORF type:complete len:442 (+),score=59.15 TRINITY_DN74139_c0_g1_i1:48-1373(+)